MEELEKKIFDIISSAGQARSLFMLNIQDSESGKFDEIEKRYEEAKECLKDAEKAHFEIITNEAKEKSSKLSLLLVHAEDQMMAAELLQDLSMSIVRLNKKVRN
ncbi:PTS lactose/cellobiose transporter subunit IIA [Lactobacillus gigeriorum]|uniref:Lichenan-specific phosphotransferase enzyme IIA component n=1 Tax=Lactobacillus gigeriorum DSM 23908 = CRBIP 24.85 TaxID=1423751 RepID=I7LCD7_9LACO|nr:PTS lactose/cellobiose transporter subunit IIA [Lactobacillus gigeriorum]KRN11946.1 hypothetical protein FC38_GL000470 [Lactobacillus gigeriorum DSM 23908 = CRBIP 24.85]CCI86401.1 Lichenan-specific phosphotransferase enzyme IIA component [Lactobacillus gigeriorum DSM 23908 = CRBIP 24.85]